MAITGPGVIDALTAGQPGDAHPKRRLADIRRVVASIGLTVATASVLFSGSSGGNSNQKSRAGLAEVLGWTGGQLIVGAVGLAVIARG